MSNFDDMLKLLQREYIQGIPEKINKIQKASTQKDFTAIQREFHNLKGSGASHGIPEISTLGKDIENYCLNNKNQDHLLSHVIPLALALMQKIEQSRQQNLEFHLQQDSQYQQLLKELA